MAPLHGESASVLVARIQAAGRRHGPLDSLGAQQATQSRVRPLGPQVGQHLHLEWLLLPHRLRAGAEDESGESGAAHKALQGQLDVRVTAQVPAAPVRRPHRRHRVLPLPRLLLHGRVLPPLAQRLHQADQH